MIDVELTNKRGVTLATNGKYCTDNIKVTPQNADNIIPENIKKDVEILGVAGSLEPLDTTSIAGLVDGSLEAFNIPDGVRRIRGHAFFGLSKLHTIHIPNSVTSIGQYAFSDTALSDDFIIPASVTTLGYRCCNNIKITTTINILSQVNKVIDQMFLNCLNLIDVIIPSNITRVSAYAFQSCSNIENIEIYGQLGGSSYGCFSNASKCTSIYLCKQNSNVEYRTFLGCTKVTNFIVEQGFNTSLDIHYSTQYNRETLVNILNNYADMTGKSTVKLTLGSENLAKLTDEDKLIATNKNITLA